MHAVARYADDLPSATSKRLGRKVRRAHNAAKLVELERPPPLDQHLQPPRRSRHRRQRRRRQEGRRSNDTLGRYIVLQDVYGNRYTYAHLGSVSKRYPVPKRMTRTRTARRTSSARARAAAREPKLPKPTAPASAGRQRRKPPRAGAPRPAAPPRAARRRRESRRSGSSPTRRARNNRPIAQETGQLNEAQLGKDGFEVFRVYFSRVFRLSPTTSS